MFTMVLYTRAAAGHVVLTAISFRYVVLTQVFMFFTAPSRSVFERSELPNLFSDGFAAESVRSRNAHAFNDGKQNDWNVQANDGAIIAITVRTQVDRW